MPSSAVNCISNSTNSDNIDIFSFAVSLSFENNVDDEKAKIEISDIVQLDNDWTVEKGLKELSEKFSKVKKAIEEGWKLDLKEAWKDRLETIYYSMQEDTGYFVGVYEDDYPTDQEKFGEVNVDDLADTWLIDDN